MLKNIGKIPLNLNLMARFIPDLKDWVFSRPSDKYFVILSSEDHTSKSNYVNSATDVSLGYVFQREITTVSSGTIVRPATSIKIQCYEEKPLDCDVIDAMFYWQVNASSASR